ESVRAPRADVDAWTVQLGSFSDDANARRLIDKLRKAGHPAYLERRVDGEKTVFKVRVGPQIRREEAEQVRDRLEQEFALKGMLVRYR
ncbi:MAG: SPOR domain-containing protein, partial [Gammaproteobacteria bacterium]